MATLRTSATACTRCLSSQNVAGAARWRPESPCRNPSINCMSTINRMSTIQQTYKNHTVSSNSNQGADNKQNDKQNKESSWKDQAKAFAKVGESISQTLSSLSVLSTVIPPRLVNELQRYLPSSTAFREKVDSSITEVKNSISEKQAVLKKYERKIRGKNQIAKSSDISDDRSDKNFVKAIQDMNESIVSYYDTSAAANATSVPASVTEGKKSDEEIATGIFQSIWSSGTQTKDSMQTVKKPLVRKYFVSKASIDRRTRALVENLKKAKSTMSRISRTEELCKHLLQYPDSRGLASKEKVLPLLLKFSKANDKALKSIANEALSLVGYVAPVKGRGITVLTIDGGGTRGLVAIESLKSIERLCNTEVHHLFDYVCGVSTGALIAAMVFLYRVPLNECEDLYKEFSQQMFTRNKLLGTSKLMWNHAFYDSEFWEAILKEQLGEKVMIEFARDPTLPKMSGVSCLINIPKMKNFVFRNYNLPPNVYSYYPGSCNHKLWEVIRASSAAPGYFDSFVNGDFVHQDGGLLTNNPTALALHESKILWPDNAFQCVVSLGTGRHEPNLEICTTSVTLKDKVTKIVDSATDTEAVHMTMQDLLPPATYFRLNPYMSEEFVLDEIRSQKMEQMQQDAQMYLRKNEVKLQTLVKQLTQKKRPHQKFADWVNGMADQI